MKYTVQTKKKKLYVIENRRTKFYNWKLIISIYMKDFMEFNAIKLRFNLLSKELSHWSNLVKVVCIFSTKDKMSMFRSGIESSSVLSGREETVVHGPAFLPTGRCWLAHEPTNQCTEPAHKNLGEFGLEIFWVRLVQFVHRREFELSNVFWRQKKQLFFLFDYNQLSEDIPFELLLCGLSRNESSLLHLNSKWTHGGEVTISLPLEIFVIEVIFQNRIKEIKYLTKNLQDIVACCKVGDRTRGWPEGFLFNSYYTKV